MPATSRKQMDTARMAYAVKMGKAKMEDMPAGAHDAIKSMMGMSESDLKDMMRMARRRHPVSGKRMKE